MHRDTIPLEQYQLRRLLGVGVAVWAAIGVGVLLLHGLWATFAIALQPMLSGYLPGGLAMVVYGIVQRWRGRIKTPIFVWALIVYFLPAGLVLTIWWGIVWIPPEVQDDPGITRVTSVAPILSWLPGVLVYFIGLKIGFGQKKQGIKQAALGLLALPGGMSGLYCVTLLLAMSCSPVWRLRKDFGLSNEHVAQQPGQITAEGVLELKRESQYSFGAMYGQEELRRGVWVEGVSIGIPIEWLDADHQLPRKAGTYRFRVSWPRHPSGEPYDILWQLHPTQVQPAKKPRQFILQVYTKPSGTSSRPLLIREFHIPLS